MQKNNTPLFLSQAYRDNWDDYMYSLNRPGFPCWDYVIITASNEQQARGFRAQIEARKAYLPSRTRFVVIPDEGGVRVGSGGATLSVIRYIRQQEKNFAGLRILVIHSGGDSKRVPQYSALGKLFSPVPRQLPDGRPSTLFDEFMISMAPIPGRIRSGMVLLAGDVLLLCNPLQIHFSGNGAAAISFKEPVETGKNHGVFLSGDDGNVARFLHKQTVETLRAMGAVNNKDCVDIDTGALIFGPDILEALYSLVAEEGGYRELVNDRVRLSLYGDFLYPMATDSTLAQFYKEKPEGQFCDALQQARTKIWQMLRPFRLKLLQLSPARFLHFGTTGEILALMCSQVQDYRALGWQKQIVSCAPSTVACYNSILSDEAEIGENCYLEAAYVHRGVKLGGSTVLSHVEVQEGEIPTGVVLHGLKLKDGKFVARIYGITDNPKEAKLFGKDLGNMDDIWDSEDRSLWTAKLYPVCDTQEQAVAAALNTYEVLQGRGDFDAWKDARRTSLSQGFLDADADAIIAWNSRMTELVDMEALLQQIRAGVPADQTGEAFRKAGKLTADQEAWLEEWAAQADYLEAARLYYYVGKNLSAPECDRYLAKCFGRIRAGILQQEDGAAFYRQSCAIAADRVRVQSPLRVNWGGGWSDTPPYCMENGGTVLNAAILLSGEKPVEVTLKRLEEKKIVLDSRDMDVHGEFTDIEALQQTGDPYDPFALQKAALIVCGIIPETGGDLTEILTRMGGGFCMNSEVTNVPKGSGLGTSSILAATCVMALLDFTGMTYTREDVFDRVLRMEQLMGTGGGWQDQVGGIVDGVKLIRTQPGLKQKIQVEQVVLPQRMQALLEKRFCLIYTGQRRLARNILRDVVGRYLGNCPENVEALKAVQAVAEEMRSALVRSDLAQFAALMNRHWELSKIIDKGTTNGAIDQIFLAIDDLIDGKMICGAGGGGFLQVILTEGITQKQLQQRLTEEFPDSGVEIWPCQLVL